MNRIRKWAVRGLVTAAAGLLIVAELLEAEDGPEDASEAADEAYRRMMVDRARAAWFESVAG